MEVVKHYSVEEGLEIQDLRNSRNQIILLLTIWAMYAGTSEKNKVIVYYDMTLNKPPYDNTH